MATPSHAVYAMLTAAGGLTALVSDRIFPGLVPQDKALPAVGYGLISAERESAFVSDSDLVPFFYRITCLGSTYDECEAVRVQARKACQRQRGSYGGITVTDTFIETEVGPEPQDDPKGFESFVDIQLRTTEV